MVDHPSELPVPLADVETAQRIADAARTGRPVDRSPTIEQLLAAFGQDPATGPGTRVRVEQALKLAGVGVSPPLVDVPEGSRVFLTPGRGPGGGKGRVRRLLLGLLVLALLIGGVTAAALTLGDDGGGRASSLPAGTTTPGTTAPASTAETTSPAGTTATTEAASTPSTASSTASTATGTATDAADAAAAAEKAAAKKEAAAAKKDRAAERRRREKAAADRRAAEARRIVVVSVQPREPTYLCAKNGAGRVLFAGTLSRKRVFRSGTVRLNVGTSSAIVRVRGNRFPLSGSPAGVLAQAGGRTPVSLPSGQRPSC